MAVDTLFKRVTKIQENGRLKIYHDINQFVWYRDGQAYSKGRENAELVSAVKFELPYGEGEQSPNLLVVGNGLDFCDVYFYKLGSPHFLTSKPSKMWRLFSHKGSLQAPEFGWKKQPAEKIDFNNIFTTTILPFLYGGLIDYPVDCLRIYDFHLGGFEKLHVIADNREKSFEKKLEIVYLPDKRYGPPQKIIELKKHQDKGLFSDDLEKKICTDNFKYR